MRRIAIALLAVLALWAATIHNASAGSAALNGGAEAKIESRNGGRFLVTRSRNFELTQFEQKGDVKTAVVESEISHRRRLSEDLGTNGDETGRVSLMVHPVNQAGSFDPPLASRALPGDEIKVEGSGGVTVVTYGCCQESDAETQLSLATLKTLYIRSSAVPLLTCTRLGKPAIARIAAVYIAMTPADEAVLGADPSMVGTITWAADDGPLQRIAIHLKAEKPQEAVLEWADEIGWKGAGKKLESHVVIDPTKPSTPVFIWRIAEGKSIELRLVGDHFDLASAKTPSGVTLREMPH